MLVSLISRAVETSSGWCLSGKDPGFERVYCLHFPERESNHLGHWNFKMTSKPLQLEDSTRSLFLSCFTILDFGTAIDFLMLHR